MAPTPPPETITLKIKVPPGHLNSSLSSSPNSSSDSFDLGSIPVSTRLGTLRQQIQSTIPSKPSPERQRLLYGGRALVDNEQTLADALNTKRDATQTEYVIHLLVKGEGLNTALPASSQPSLDVAAGATLGTATGRSVSPLGGLPAQQPLPQGLPGRSSGTPMNPSIAQQQGQHHSTDPSTTNSGTPPHAPSLNPQQQPQGHRRPLSAQGFHVQGTGPNGQRFEIHQQTFNFPHGPHGPNPGMPMQMPSGFINMPYMPHGMPAQLPGMMHGPNMHGPQPPAPQSAGQAPPFAQMPSIPQMPLRDLPRPGRPTALGRAREDIAAMQRLIDEQRSQEDPATTRRLDEFEQRIRNLNDYIDPFGSGLGILGAHNTRHGAEAAGRSSAPPDSDPLSQSSSAMRSTGRPSIPGIATQHRPSTTDTNDVTAYLLSGPHGPHALLFSPQHGTFHGGLPRAQPTPTRTAGSPPAQQLRQMVQRTRQDIGFNEPQQPNAAGNPDRNPARAAIAPRQAGPNNVPAGLQQQQQDPLAPFQPILAHAWLLFRLLIFAYFFLGSNLGYTKPLILAGIGLIFWAVRMGALGVGDQGRDAVRRWWEGVVGVPQRRPEGQGQGGEAGGENGQAPAGANAAAPQEGQGQQAHPQEQQRGAMPTPEQLAQRLLDRQDARHRERRNWLREQIRPVERAVALFVATLWPGVGEGLVQEQRRAQAEAEAEAARIEAERRRREEEAHTEAARAREEEREAGGKREGEVNTDAGTVSATGVDTGNGEDGVVERRVASAGGSSETAPPANSD